MIAVYKCGWRNAGRTLKNSKVYILGVGDAAAICHPAWALHFNSTFKCFNESTSLSSLIIILFFFFRKSHQHCYVPSREHNCIYPSLYKTLHLDNHYHAFVVELNTQIVYIGLSVLVYTYSLCSHKKLILVMTVFNYYSSMALIMVCCSTLESFKPCYNFLFLNNHAQLAVIHFLY